MEFHYGLGILKTENRDKIDLDAPFFHMNFQNPLPHAIFHQPAPLRFDIWHVPP